MPRRSNPIKLNPPSLRDTSLTGKIVGRHCYADKYKCQDSNPDLHKFTFAKQTVNSLPSCLPALRKSSAFTLAETLITLGLIGVVAAMVLPSVLLDIRNNQLKAQFKAANSIVSRAVEKMSMDEPDIVGTYCGYDIFTAKDLGAFGREFIKYFNDAKFSVRRGNYQYKNPLGYGIIRTSSGTVNDNPYILNGPHIILKNNMRIIIRPSCSRTGNGLSTKTPRPVPFLVDINGPKGPNRVGFDIFNFEILRGNRLNTQSLSYTKEQTYEGPSPTDCNYTKSANSDQGVSCIYYAVLDESPTDRSKSYWKNLPRK